MSQQTALENNQTSKTAYTYGPGAQVTEQDDYDYGNGSPGNLLRQYKMTYESFGAMTAWEEFSPSAAALAR